MDLKIIDDYSLSSGNLVPIMVNIKKMVLEVLNRKHQMMTSRFTLTLTVTQKATGIFSLMSQLV